MYSYSYSLTLVAVHFALAGTFCGVFRRQALDRGAMALKVDKIVTGQLAALIERINITNILTVFKYNVIASMNVTVVSQHLKMECLS